MRCRRRCGKQHAQARATRTSVRTRTDRDPTRPGNTRWYTLRSSGLLVLQYPCAVRALTRLPTHSLRSTTAGLEYDVLTFCVPPPVQNCFFLFCFRFHSAKVAVLGERPDWLGESERTDCTIQASSVHLYSTPTSVLGCGRTPHHVGLCAATHRRRRQRRCHG